MSIHSSMVKSYTLLLNPNDMITTYIQTSDRYGVLFTEHDNIYLAYLILIEPGKVPVPMEEPMSPGQLRICWASMVHGDRDANEFKKHANRCIDKVGEHIGVYKAEDEVNSF